MKWHKAWWTALPSLAGVVVAATLVSLLVAWRAARDLRWIARKIEARYPELDTALVAAVEQEPQLPSGRFGFLQESVFSEALAHSRRNDWLGMHHPYIHNAITISAPGKR